MKLYKMLIAIGFGAIFLANTSNAALVDQDWKTPGDASLLLDTDTGLRWLDLSATANVSRNAVGENLGVGGAFGGFRLATQSEVLTLWKDAGISNTERTWVTGQYLAVHDLVNRLGPTVMVELGQFLVATHTIGMVDGGSPLPGNQIWAMELTYAPDGMSTRTSASYYTRDAGVAGIHYSTYLVQAVPLPGALWLFLSGGVGLLTLSRKLI